MTAARLAWAAVGIAVLALVVQQALPGEAVHAPLWTQVVGWPAALLLRCDPVHRWIGCGRLDNRVRVLSAGVLFAATIAPTGVAFLFPVFGTGVDRDAVVGTDARSAFGTHQVHQGVVAIAQQVLAAGDVLIDVEVVGGERRQSPHDAFLTGGGTTYLTSEAVSRASAFTTGFGGPPVPASRLILSKDSPVGPMPMRSSACAWVSSRVGAKRDVGTAACPRRR
ncbi:hypothetical protein [Kineococcus arenarius]|uniref:hypothetical protein n=1 Tax=Kineococcus sp. SYSU DK007 TaxID=3383128 RepID=UPI003D7CDD04